MTHHAPCVVLPWDSEFFGLRIGRVVLPALTRTDVAAAVEWAETNAVVCLYALVDTDDAPSRAALEACRFRAVDERLTLRRRIGSPTAMVDGSVRRATLDDAGAVAAIARVSHHNTRFYADGGFDLRMCDELYARWVVQTLSERDAAVMVSVEGGRVTGYFTLHGLGDPECRVGLVAVVPDEWGRGIGKSLMGSALNVAAEAGATHMMVITQGGSEAAVRYYETSGFQRARTETWYHRWS